MWLRFLWIFLLLCYCISHLAAESVEQWPRQYTLASQETIYLYPPQIESWHNHEQLSGRTVFGYQEPGGKEAYGSAEFTANTTVVDQQVTLKNITFNKPNFPLLNISQVQQLIAKINTLFVAKALQVPKSYIHISQGELPEEARTMAPKTTPPEIIYRTHKTILLQTNGKAVLSPIDQSSLQYVINSNWDVFFNPSNNTWYLRDNKSWLQTAALDKPWQAVKELPYLFQSLLYSDSWKKTQTAIPAQAWQGQPPEVVYRDHPSELLVVNGQPKLSIISKQLSWVTNTNADLFYDSTTGRWYYLVSGRWFSTSDLTTGHWLFSSDNLPKAFAEIPPTHSKATVLAQVPGTPEAQEAALQASIPKQGTVSRKITASVNYAGSAKFEPVAKDNVVYRATNSNYPVFRYNSRYYMCKNAMWFTSSRATGPWVLTDEVPQAIYSIPPSSPDYNVIYVSVAYSTPSTVTYIYTPGYYGVYISNWSYGATVVFGTGWYYPPYVYPVGVVPIYYPYPVTYGAAAWYNVNTGFYSHGGAIYGPYCGTFATASFNPSTGTYVRTAGAWNNNGYRTANRFYNPRNGVAGGASGSNSFAQWGHETAVGNRGNWVSGRYYQNDNGFSTAHIQSNIGNGIHVSQGVNGNVFAGREGDIYKHSEDSGWQHYNNGNWESVQHSPRPTPYSSNSLSQRRPNTDFQNREFQHQSFGNRNIQRQQFQNHQYLNRQSFSRGHLQGHFGGGAFRGKR